MLLLLQLLPLPRALPAAQQQQMVV